MLVKGNMPILLRSMVCFWSNATTCPCGLHGPPSWAWQECNRLLRLGRPWDAVTLSRWCEWWYRRSSARRTLKPKFYQPTQTVVTTGILPFKENSHGTTGNRTLDLIISSQRLWPLDHEAGHCAQRINLHHHSPKSAISYGTSPCFGHYFYYAVCFNVPCQVTPHFDKRSLVSFLTPFGWLPNITLSPYFWWEYYFCFKSFSFSPTFSGTQIEYKKGVGCTSWHILNKYGLN